MQRQGDMEDPRFSGNGVQNEWRLVGDEAGGFTGEGCEFDFREFCFLQVQLRR